jgi:AraC family transcriptional regulator
LIAPGTETYFERGGLLTGLSLHVSPCRLRDLLGDEEGERAAKDFRTRLGFHDPFSWAVVQALTEEARDPGERGALCADAMADALILRLLRSSASRWGDEVRVHGLPIRSLRAVRERIEENLEEGVSVSELAADVGMTRRQFTKAFQQATGMAPYRYVTQRRLERSKVLLRQSDLPLAEVALACGFANQSHFCDRFRANIGVSPGEYRARS